MFKNFQIAFVIRSVLILVFVVEVLIGLPVQASSDISNTTTSKVDLLSSDSPAKNKLDSFGMSNLDIQVDPVHSPMVSPEIDQTLAPLFTTTIGNWSALGSNLTGTDGAISNPQYSVWDIAVSGTDVYIVGCFVNVGGDPTADNVAKWDGTKWSGLGNDGANPPDGAVKGCIRSIAVSGNDVYVGSFGPGNNDLNVWIGGSPAPQANGVAKWNGTTWSGLGGDGTGGSSITSGSVRSIVAIGTDVYVGGTFTDVKNGTTTLTEADYIAKWNGTNWSALGDNGSGNGALDQIVYDMAAIGNDLYVGGGFHNVYNGSNLVTEASLIAKWDGAQWSGLGGDGNPAVGGAVNGTVYAVGTDGSNLYVGGSIQNINNNGVLLTEAVNIAKWDGTNWFALGGNGNPGDLNGSLNDRVISIVTVGADVYAVGGFTNVNNNGIPLPAADYVAKWDGTNWSALGSNGSGGGSLNNYAYSLAHVGDKLYVGGDFTNVNNNGIVLNTADYIAAYALGDGVFRVASNGLTTPSCGKDWSTPCDLQYALTSLASSGGELWVKAETYKPTITTDRAVSFTLKNGVAIYGGFAGTETLRTQRNPSTNITILSGEIGAAGNADNSYHVVLGSSTDNTAVLDGFTVTAGNANGTLPYNLGGGMYSSYGNPSLTNLIFSANFASDKGGGMYTTYGVQTLSNVVFSGNSANAAGGGMYNYSSWTTMTNATFLNNSTITSSSDGGGMVNYDGTSTLTDVTFSNNSSVYGGGMVNINSFPTLTNVTFSNNSAAYAGGGMVNTNSNATLTNVTFSGNSSATRGGGMDNNVGSNVILKNVTFSANHATQYGGAIYNDDSDPTLTNVILWNDTAFDGAELYNYNAMPTISYSIVQGSGGSTSWNAALGINNGSNLDTNPALGTLANNGGFAETLALGSSSSAIDAGSDASCSDTDQRGVTRPLGWHCDIGAYEYQPAIRYVKWNATGLNNGSSWTNAYTNLLPALYSSSSGDEIWVAAGTYKPNQGIERHHSFFLVKGVAVYGGFMGTETLRTQRNPSTNVTILSGDIGTVGDNSDNSYHVVVGNGTNNTTVLDGFTITAGNANVNNFDFYAGGGMYNNNGSPSLANLIFNSNSAGSGGGMYNVNSAPSLVNVTFTDNTAEDGGGLENYTSNPSLNNVNFISNSATASIGGGMFNFGSSPNLTNVLFANNTAYTVGGGVGNQSGSNAILTNVTFYNNSSNDLGGGMANSSSNPDLTNVTFSANTSNNGGGIYNSASNPAIKNGILWDNIGGDLVNVNSSVPVVTYSIVQSGYAGTGNLNSDPLLGTLANNGGVIQTIALSTGSPAIDAGIDTGCPSSDQRGVVRPQGSHCDMGAYEYQDTIPPTVVSFDPEDETINVPVDKVMTITFNEEIDPATVNGSSLFLTPFNSNAAISSTLSVTGNVVTLTPDAPLAVGTTYWLQVTGGVADLAGNQPLGQVWLSSFTTGPNGFIDTTSSHFAAGSAGSCYISTINNGEVNQSPLIGEEFSGASLPIGWSQVPSNAGAVILGNGMISVDAATAYYSTSTFSAGHQLIFAATFGAGESQQVGLVGNPDFSDQWAVFSTNGTTDKLYAVTSDGQSTLLAGDFIGTKHTYEINWQAGAVYFFVDGFSATATHTVALTNLRAALRDSNPDGMAVTVDWMHFTPYSSPCTFTSRIFDAGQVVDWLNLGRSAGGSQGVACIVALPPDPPICTPNYGLTLETRTGNSAIPNETWSSWETAAFAIPSPDGRYLQYRVALSSDVPGATSRLYSVVATYLTLSSTTTTTVGNANTIYGSTTVNLTATISPNPEGGTVQFYVDGNSTGSPVAVNVSNGTAILAYNPSSLNVGAHTIRADFSGSGSFLSSSSNPGNNGILTVTKATLTITANDQSRAYGTANPNFDASFTGFVNGETLGTSGVTGSPSCTSTATSTSSVSGNPYAITCSIGTLIASNYSFIFASGALTVTKATPTLSVTNSPVLYDGSPHSAMVIGSVPGIVSNILTGGLASQTNIGTYAVTANFAPTDSANYNALTYASADNFVISSDVTPPDTQLNSQPVNPTASADAVFAFSSLDDNTATFECRLDGGSYASCVSPKSYINLTGGAHTFEVRAKDASNNIDVTPASYTWMIDLTFPIVTSVQRLDPSPTNTISVDFAVSLSESATGVDISDFALTTTGVIGVVITSVNGSGDSYTVTVNTGSGNGTIRLDIVDNDSIKDVANNLLGGIGTGNGNFTSGEIYNIRKSPIFNDVQDAYWAVNAIERLYNAGITGGCLNNPLSYCPENTVTRAQMAVFLLKGIHGSSYTPPAVGSDTGFGDVPTSYWAATWIKQLAAEGITGGCGGGNFCPDAPVTRAQMAVFLLKSKHGVAYTPSLATGVFSDVPVGYWADKWIEQLAAEGITSGCTTSPLNYCPDSSVTRAQMAVFLVKTFNLP